MAKLNTEPNLTAPDDFYEQLIATHRGLSDAQSALVNAQRREAGGERPVWAGGAVTFR